VTISKGALGFLLLAVITACGGSSDEPSKSAASAVSSPVATASASPTVKTATIGQYASIVAEQRAAISERAKELEGCVLDASDFVCKAGVLSASLEAQTLDIKLESAGVDGPGNQVFIGAPPDEIAALVAETRAAAKALQAKADLASECKGKCISEFADASFAASDLNDKLAGWEPYL
jgi:hypothetical protein